MGLKGLTVKSSMNKGWRRVLKGSLTVNSSMNKGWRWVLKGSVAVNSSMLTTNVGAMLF